MKKLISLLCFALLLTSCSMKTKDDITDEVTTDETSTDESVTELVIEDLTVGTGEEAKAGDLVEVHYVGTLTDGTQFDSSRDRGQTFSFRIGAGEVIQGWEEGIPGMKVGGIRKLTIPSDMAYEDVGVLGGATLIFEVELISIQE